MRVTSMDSAKVKGGRRSVNALANKVLPEPGGPDIRTLWPPAAATVKALLATAWPLMSRNDSPLTPVSLSAGRTPGTGGGEGVRTVNSGRDGLKVVQVVHELVNV